MRERTLLINAAKTGRRRTVRLLAAARRPTWRVALRLRPARRGARCSPASAAVCGPPNGFEKWRQRALQVPRSQAAGAELRAAPYDLRHSFASLLLHEGRDVIYVARQLGHGADLTLRTYGHVIEELEDSPQLPAEEAIRRARETRPVTVYPFCTSRARSGESAAGATPMAASAPSRIRTCGLLLRRESLYPAELSGPAARGTARRTA